MTRAKERLYLSSQGDPERDSWAEALEPHWAIWQSSPIVQFVEYESQDSASLEIPSPSIKVRERFSSQALSAEKISEETEAPMSWDILSETNEKRVNGVVLHRIFEALKFHPCESVTELAQQWLPNVTNIEAAISFIWNNHEVPFQPLILNGEVEWGYTTKKDGNLQERRIDLWGQYNDTLWIVDYKTGSPKYRDKAFEQMSEYAETLKAHLNWQQPVQMCAVYPFSQNLFVQTY